MSSPWLQAEWKAAGLATDSESISRSQVSAAHTQGAPWSPGVLTLKHSCSLPSPLSSTSHCSLMVCLCPGTLVDLYISRAWQSDLCTVGAQDVLNE